VVNKILVILALAAVVFAGWYLFVPSDEARVKETFKNMAAALDKSGNEPNFDAIGKARRAVALVEPGCTCEAFGKTFTLSKSAPDITQRVIAFRTMAANMHFAFEDISVKFTGGDTAEVTCDFFYKGDDFDLTVRDARALDATMRKDPESGRWRFARVRLTNIIEK